MSARFVRHKLRTWAAEVFTVPFVDTVNLTTSPNGSSSWASVRFDPETETKISYCDDIEAAGLAEFVFSGPPGVGDNDLLGHVDDSIAALLARQDTPELVLINAREPVEASAGSADHFYRVNVGVEYRYYYRRE